MINRDKLPYRKSTLALVVNVNDKFLLVNKQVYAPDKWWSFPGGGG